jgi:hypothetical protein
MFKSFQEVGIIIITLAWNTSYNCFKNAFGYFFSIDLFQSDSHVPIIYYECCYITKPKNLNANLNYHLQI